MQTNSIQTNSPGQTTAEDAAMMLLAIEQARIGIRQGQSPFGAVIARKGQVLAAGHNLVWQTTDITAHAEVSVIRKACASLKSVDLSGATVYSTTEPCPMCFSACHWARVSRIVYGAAISDAAAAGFHELHVSNECLISMGGSEIVLVPGFMRQQCVKLFDEFLAAGGSQRLY